MKQLSDETADAIRKVRELAALREDYVSKKGLPLSFKQSCMKLGISPTTVNRHAPELYERWKDTSFHWEISDE
jgi:hypothetical protein